MSDDWAERMADVEPLYVLLTYDPVEDSWVTDTNASDQGTFIDALLSVLGSFATGQNVWDNL